METTNIQAWRQRRVNAVLVAVLLCNLAVSAVKIIVGLMTAMPSVTADGYHSITDGLSNVIGLIGVHMAEKPVDSDHAYGHKRYERLFTLWIAGLLFYLGMRTVENALSGGQDFRIPNGVEFALISGTLVFNVFVAGLEALAGRRLASPLLLSDAKHTVSDIWITAGVIVSVGLIKYAGAPRITDSAVSLCIAAVIFRTSWDIYREAADELTDHIAVEPERIASVVLDDPDVRSVHKIRSRISGDIVYADFHVQCDPEMKLRDVHAMTHRIAAELRKKLGMNINCVIHTEDEKSASKHASAGS